jgi:hypothetical protein
MFRYLLVPVFLVVAISASAAVAQKAASVA